MARLDKDRQKDLEPKRLEYAKSKIIDLGYELTLSTDTRIEFYFNEKLVRFYPYSGWYTGKSIKDGRGIENLLEKLK